MQLAWSRIWTHVAVSIYYYNNDYTMGISKSNIVVNEISQEIQKLVCEW